MTDFLAGFAEVDFTPEPGLKLRGQQYERIGEYKRDPLMANAVAMRWGDETVVIVSNDVCFVTTEFVTETQRIFSERAGIPAERLLIHTTHSHVAPAAVPYYWAEPDAAFIAGLQQAIISSAESAIAKLEPVTVWSGVGQLDLLNWNRRSMYANGASAMHGSADRPGFLGTEGTRDPNLSVVFFRNSAGRIIGLIPNFGTHPNCIDNACCYSADLPGELRRLLKSVFGADAGVVYLTGAAGNTAPIMREPGRKEQPFYGEEGLARAGLYMTGEVLKILAQATTPIQSPDLAFAHAVVRIPMRPFPEPGERNYPDFWSDESRAYYQSIAADWPRRLRDESPVEVRVNVVRIGDTVICTNPAELFAEFALEIRTASPARVTLVSQLTDGYVGYVPTEVAFTRGGYETWPSGTSKLVPEAGTAMVEATAVLMGKLNAAQQPKE